MDETSKWLEEIKSRAALFSEGYRLELRLLWWANLMFVVVPAVLSPSAAIVAALSPPNEINILSVHLPVASVFAGTAAGLIAIHKALKSDEDPAAGLPLGQNYESIGIASRSAPSKPT